MAIPPQIRVLFFDVFGTCVAQRPSLADELSKATKEVLNSGNKLINDDVRAKAEAMSYERWFEFGGEWNRSEEAYVRDSIAEKQNVDWKVVDQRRIESFYHLLTKYGLIIPIEISGSRKPGVQDGSLWSEAQIQHLGRVWHRLPPWPDTSRGLEMLNKKYTTVALSNTYQELIKSLVGHSNIPFQHVFSSDLFDSYKPNPKVYLGAAKRLGFKPEECALVAAHLSDLKGAKACGFHAIYVERPLEEKTPDLRSENIPNLVVPESENGLIALAERLSISE